MRRYSILHPIFLSFFSKSLYRDVGRNWKGIGLKYLLLILLITWLPIMIRDYVSAVRRLPGVRKFADQFPRITISHGEVSCDAPMPFVIRDLDTNKPEIIIDTSGQTINLDNTSAEYLLTKTKLIYKDTNSLTGETSTNSFDLSFVSYFYIDRDRVRSILALFFYGAFPAMYLISFGYRLIQVLIYGSIGMLFASQQKVALTYQALVRLSVIAITPVLLLETVADLINLPEKLYMCGGSILALGISLAYLFFAVKANAAPSDSQPFAA